MSLRADPKALPNIDVLEDGAGFELSSFADGSGLNELSSLNAVDPKTLPGDFSSFGGKADPKLLPDPKILPVDVDGFGGKAEAVEVPFTAPKMLPDGLLPLPKILELLLSPPSEAKPPLLANPAKPPEAGASVGVEEGAALANGL